jgi:hypothetical protein
MNTRVFGIATVAVTIGLVGMLAAPTAQAASINAGGWSFTWLTTDFSVTPLGINGSTLGLEKAGTFDTGPDQFGLVPPFEINVSQTTPVAFGQLPATATDYFSLIENLTNNTGVDWNGFRIIIEDGTTGTNSDVRFDTSTLATLLNVGASPSNLGLPVWSTITTVLGAAGTNVQEIVFSGGVLHNGEAVRIGGILGEVNGGSIGIFTPRSELGTVNWVLKELPLTTPPIPLPAAVWSSLSGLAGLGLFGAMNRVRRQTR